MRVCKLTPIVTSSYYDSIRLVFISPGSPPSALVRWLNRLALDDRPDIQIVNAVLHDGDPLLWRPDGCYPLSLLGRPLCGFNYRYAHKQAIYLGET